MLLNKDVLMHDPAGYRLADGGVAKVSFPPDNDQKAILREQLQTFVCEGAYAEGTSGSALTTAATELISLMMRFAWW